MTKDEDRIEAALLTHALAFGVMEGIDLETSVKLIRELYENGGVEAKVCNGDVTWSAANTDAIKVFGLKTALYKHAGTRH